MKYTSTLVVECEDSEKLYKALEADISQQQEKERSKLNIEKKEKKLIFNIVAKDATALRATLSSLTQLLSVYEKTKNLIKNG